MNILLWIFGFAFFLAFAVGPLFFLVWEIIEYMNKKARKVVVRHDRHVVNNKFKAVVDTAKTPEEAEEYLYEKKSKIREEKRG